MSLFDGKYVVSAGSAASTISDASWGDISLGSVVLASGFGLSLAGAAALAAPYVEDPPPVGQLSLIFVSPAVGCTVSAGSKSTGSWLTLPAFSAARRRADAIGSARGLEIGCQGYCF